MAQPFALGSGIILPESTGETNLFPDHKDPSLQNSSGSIGYPSIYSSSQYFATNSGELLRPAESDNAQETAHETGGAIQQAISSTDEGYQYPNSWALTTMVTGLCLAIFLVSLDRTIVTTAIPYISNDFQAYSDIGWFGSSYLLTSSVLQPIFGRIYSLFSIKRTYLISLIIFEVGSIICATASTSQAFVVGRAITGLGSAGVLSGSFVVVAHGVPLKKRPIYTAVVGMFYSLGAVAGPLLGGIFTSLATWRWCFWISLPLGGSTIIAMLFFFKPKKRVESGNTGLLTKISSLDVGGTVLLLGAAVMFFLALQYADQGIPWKDSNIIGLLTGTGVVTVVFIIWQLWRGEHALIPPSIMFQRSVGFACLAAFALYSTLLLHNFFLPEWFQAIKGRSALISGVDMIPYLVSAAVASIVGGVLVNKIGYYSPPSIIGCSLALLGSGLFCTLSVSESDANWVGFSILAGAGVGLAVQQGFMAVQTVLTMQQVTIGTAAITFFQALGGSIFISIGNTIITKRLEQVHVTGVDIVAVVKAGSTDFQRLVPPTALRPIREAYNAGIQDVFIMAAVLCSISVLASCGLEWRSVKVKQSKEQNIEKQVIVRRETGQEALSKNENVTEEKTNESTSGIDEGNREGRAASPL